MKSGILDDTGRDKISVESKQLLRFKRLKDGDCRVPPTYRIYTENGKKFQVITDLTDSNNNFVWSSVDKHDIPNPVIQKINWVELAQDLVNNAFKATASNAWIEKDTHVIVISDKQSYDYLANLDVKPVLYDQELGIFDLSKETKFSLRAINITEAWKAFLELAKHDAEHLSVRSTMFWNIASSLYPEAATILKDELLTKSMLSTGLSDEDYALSKQIIESVFTRVEVAMDELTFQKVEEVIVTENNAPNLRNVALTIATALGINIEKIDIQAGFIDSSIPPKIATVWFNIHTFPLPNNQERPNYTVKYELSQKNESGLVDKTTIVLEENDNQANIVNTIPLATLEDGTWKLSRDNIDPVNNQFKDMFSVQNYLIKRYPDFQWDNLYIPLIN